MKKEQVLSVIRHTLTFVGGVLVAYNVVDDAFVGEFVGGILTLVGLVWGIVDKK